MWHFSHWISASVYGLEIALWSQRSLRAAALAYASWGLPVGGGSVDGKPLRDGRIGTAGLMHPRLSATSA